MTLINPTTFPPRVWMGLVIGTAPLVLVVVYAVYQLFINPLSRFPGPIWAKLSPVWLAFQCRRVERSRVIAAVHKKYGNVVRIAPNHVSINKPEALMEVYGHKAGFTKGPFYDAFMQVTPVVFTARDVSAHQRKRKYLNPAFSSRGLADFEAYMDGGIQDWIAQLDTMCKAGEAVDFCVWTNYLAFDIIGSFSFGQPFGFIKGGKDPYNLIHTIDTRGEVLNAMGTLPPWLRRLMPYNIFDDFWINGLKARAGLEKLGRQSYQQRKAALDEKKTAPRRDLLSFLFDATDPDTGRPLPEDEIIAEAISFIVGGSDTTSSTMTNFIDIVSREPRIMQKLQAELDEAFPDLAASWIAPDKVVEKLPYLSATLREVMRCRPTSSTGLERITPAGGKIVGGHFLPGGTLVSVPTLGVLHDASIYPLPDEFDPDRWLASDVAQMMTYFHPFSYGPRSCIGRNFAWMEIVKSMATLFRLFNVRRSKSEPTVIREGFFNKAVECTTVITRR